MAELTIPDTKLIPERCLNEDHEHRSLDGWLICDFRACYWDPTVKPAHRLPTKPADKNASTFVDNRRDNYRRSTKKHRAYGPENAPTMFDIHPDELTGSKGAGPRY